MRRMTGIALLIVALGTAVAAGEVREVPSRIERVSLFKNGLCVVHRVAELPGAGEFMLGQSPEPVHGTYFVTSDRAVLSRVVPCTVRVAADGAGGFSPSEDLAGQHVRIVLRDLPDRPVEGLVVATGREGGPRWDRRYEQPSHSWYYAGPTPPAAPAQTAPRFLTLQTDGGGRVYVDPAQIALIETAAAPGPVERIRPRLVLTVAEGEGPLVVRISYLA
ncbi:MAG: hypothetical protein GX591_20305, partial [Planctomycetes bacterium]|nr:hypothetical protein [Planctomycetota bacterium]